MNELSNEDIIHGIIQAEAAKKDAESHIKQLKNELLNRSETAINELFGKKDEPYGDVVLEAFNQKIKFTRPKKVEWNQEKLQKLSEQIIADGGNVNDFIDIEYSIPESKYKVWGDNTRAYFIDARTVSAGNIAIKIEEKK